MPTPIFINVEPGVLPQGYCPTGEDWLQQFQTLLLSLARFSLQPGQTFFNFGQDTPAPENRIYPWIRTVDGRIDRVYNFGNDGLWVARHDWADRIGAAILAPKSVNTQLLIDTWDGGSPGIANVTAGPMWEIDPDLVGRIPIGAGLVPGNTPALTLAVGDDAGSGTQVLTAAQLPAAFTLTSLLTGSRLHAAESGAPNILTAVGSSGVVPTTPPQETATFNFDNSGGGQPTSLLPPVHARYWLRKTIRTHYTLPG